MNVNRTYIEHLGIDSIQSDCGNEVRSGSASVFFEMNDMTLGDFTLGSWRNEIPIPVLGQHGW